MSDRVDNLSENQFIEQLQYIRKELDYMKNRQLTGDDSVITHFIEPSTHITKSGITPYDDVSWYVYYHPSSGIRTYNFMEVSGAVSNSTGFEFWNWSPAPQFINDLEIMVWKLYYFNDSNTTSVDFKVGFRTIEDGTAQWQEI